MRCFPTNHCLLSLMTCVMSQIRQLTSGVNKLLKRHVSLMLILVLTRSFTSIQYLFHTVMVVTQGNIIKARVLLL